MRNTTKLTTCAIFSAVICVVTTFISVPAPSVGNVNIGDIFILCAAWMLGPYGAISAGIGACLADLFSGYAIYAPATLVIKFLMSIACYYLYIEFFKLTKWQLFSRVFSAFTAEIVMVLGYFLYESALYGIEVAFASAPYNLTQGAICMLVGTAAGFFLLRNKTIKQFSKEFLS